MTPEERAAAERARHKFTSANSVPVDRATLTRAEFEAAIRAAIDAEMAATKAAFWETFKGAGELWFPYRGDTEPEAAVQHAWDEFAAEVDRQRARPAP